MPFLDLTHLLSPLSDDAPCGPVLEYSPEYMHAARLMEGSPDVEYGAMHLAAAEPDWRAVLSLATQLASASRDLRVAAWLTRALAALHGYAGLAQGLAFIEGLLERFWDHVHPQLDADDGLDPTARINTLIALDDKTGLVRQVYAAPLALCSGLGPVSLRDIDIAEGELPARGAEEPIGLADIDAGMLACEFSALTETAHSIELAGETMARIEALLTDRAGHRHAVGFPQMRALLRRAGAALEVRLSRHPGRVQLAAAQDGGGGEVPAARDPASISCGADVVFMLDRLCDYYARYEPSSPVPLLLKRARRLVDGSFIDILSDLTPGSLAEIKHLAGIATD
jgi:type VI secretion system protein ImpA